MKPYMYILYLQGRTLPCESLREAEIEMESWVQYRNVENVSMEAVNEDMLPVKTYKYKDGKWIKCKANPRLEADMKRKILKDKLLSILGFAVICGIIGILS